MYLMCVHLTFIDSVVDKWNLAHKIYALNVESLEQYQCLHHYPKKPSQPKFASNIPKLSCYILCKIIFRSKNPIKKSKALFSFNSHYFRLQHEVEIIWIRSTKKLRRRDTQ